MEKIQTGEAMSADPIVGGLRMACREERADTGRIRYYGCIYLSLIHI